jgi:hypothetical protein
MITVGIFLAILASSFWFMISDSSAIAAEVEQPSIARWPGGKAAAVSLRFDDALKSHVEYVIPTLNENGLKATFMVNPGKERYKNYQSFWEMQVPRMGHDLGNHTMHHEGARTVEEADFEVGEVARLIWRLYPDRGRLMVFASGGRAKWGGKDWEQADPGYKAMVKKYDLIDLYDGKHPALSAGGSNDYTEMRGHVLEAIRKGGHQPLLFHGIGTPGLIDRMKTVLRGYDLFFSRESFESLVAFLKQEKERLWIAPLLDVLKYETERESASLKVLARDRRRILLALKIDTSTELYDRALTLRIPIKEGQKVDSIRQGNRRIPVSSEKYGVVLADVKPVSGPIEVYFQ